MRRKRNTSSAQMMLLLRESVPISLAQLRYMWEDVWPETPIPSIEVLDGSFRLVVGGVEVTGRVMPTPVPDDEVMGPADTPWLWPDAEIELRGYAAHVVIAASEAESPLVAQQALTQVTAVVVRATKALGVCGGASAVVRGDVFVGLAQGDPLPISLWVDFRAVRGDDGRCGLITRGLRQFGLMELEIPASGMDPGELRLWCMNVAACLVRDRPELPHGHTIGLSAGEKIRVAHMRSMTGSGELACRLTGF